MFKVGYSDSKIVKDILTGGAERDRSLKYLLLQSEYALKIKLILEADGSSKSKSETIYDSCLVRLDKKIRRHEWNPEDSICDFLEQEAKKIWCSELIAEEETRRSVIEWIHTDKILKKQVARAIMNNSGKYEDAEDCYQNGIIYLNTKLMEGKYQGGAMKGYFYQICFNLWRNELKKSKPQNIEDLSRYELSTAIDPAEEMERKEKADKLTKAFQELGESCQKIISLKYMIIEQYSMEEIASHMGFKNAQIASNTLNKCRKRLWELLHGQIKAAS